MFTAMTIGQFNDLFICLGCSNPSLKDLSNGNIRHGAVLDCVRRLRLMIGTIAEGKLWFVPPVKAKTMKTPPVQQWPRGYTSPCSRWASVDEDEVTKKIFLVLRPFFLTTHDSKFQVVLKAFVAARLQQAILPPLVTTFHAPR